MTLSLDGSRAVIAEPAFSQHALKGGMAWVIDDPLATSQSQAQILPTPTLGTAFFGTSLALSSSRDVLAVGAPGSTNALGKLFIFRHDGVNWNQEWQAIGFANDMLGHAVVLSADGETVVVGAPLRVVGSDWGSVFTYRRIAGVWTLQSTITPLNLPLSTRIGGALALTPDGNTLAVRSFGWWPWESGAIFVLERNGSSWTPITRLIEPVFYSNGGFGMALDISADGRTLVAGNDADSRLAYSQGAVTTFRKGGSGWAYDSVLLPSVPSAGAGFGGTVALNDAGDRLWVGVPGQTLNGVIVGSVEEFELSGGGFVRTAVHFSPQPTQYSSFGDTVCSSSTGARWLAGEPQCDIYGPDAGRVLVYDAPCLAPTSYCTAQTNSLGCAAQISAQGTPSASSPAGFVIQASNLRNQQNGLLLYGASGRAALPWLGGTLCVQPPLRRTPLVNSGGSAQPALDCSGSLARDFNTLAFASLDPQLFAGQHVRAQFLSRDPGSPSNLNLSDALEFYLEP